MQVFHTLVFQFSFSVSIISATLLAICRLIAIKFPFYRIKKGHIFTALGLILVVRLLMLASAATPLIPGDTVPIFVKYCFQVMYVSIENPMPRIAIGITKLVFVPMIVAIGLTASIVTIYLLRLQPNMSQSSKTRRSSRVIAYMNICNVLITIGYVSAATFLLYLPLLYFCGTSVLPIFGSAFNPTVRFFVCSDIRKYFTEQRWKLQRSLSKTQETVTE